MGADTACNMKYKIQILSPKIIPKLAETLFS